jgi:cytochrome c peroxidase
MIMDMATAKVTKRILYILCIAAAGFVACEQKPQEQSQPPEKKIAQMMLTQVDSFAALCHTLEMAVEGNARGQSLQRMFLQARLGYKRFEWAAEYFEPATARYVNGAPVPEVELTGQTFAPAGLQVIETFLYPRWDTVHRRETLQLLKRLQSDAEMFKKHFANIDILDWQVFDAARQEVFRVETLGITGFDDPLSLESMKESAVGLGGVKQALAYYDGAQDVGDRLDTAMGYLYRHSDFNSFDRAEFIMSYANPLSIGIAGMEERLKLHPMRYNRLLSQDAKTLFDSNAFNPDAYMPDRSAFMTDEKVALGRRLFYDPLLSGTGTRSCGSCHQPDKAFADGLQKNTILGDGGLLARNTPTLINAALQPALFYDLRARSLEDQALAVVQNEKEMHGSLQLSVGRLWKDTAYRRLFAKAFVKKDRAGIDTFEVMNALGSYVRSLTRLDSRWDRYMRGDKTALSRDEINGFNLFMGQAKCGTCHYMPLFNGTFPPRYMKIESEVIGVPASADGKALDGDMGRYGITRSESFKHSFKIPTLRNVARTAPYMHNGVFATLDQVMDFYNKGGGAGVGLKVDNQTLPFDKLDLTERQRREVVAFMKSLDSR